MRSLSSAALTKIATNTGTEPVILFTSAIGNFAEKDLPGFAGKILKVNGLDDIVALENRGTSANVSITLDDTDGTLQNMLNSFDFHRAPATLLQYFEGMDIADAFVLFNGYIASPIVWDEGQRTLSIDIYSKIYGMQVGFSPESGQLPNIPPNLCGKVWPLAFGDCIDIPAVQSGEVVQGFTTTLLGFPDPTLKNALFSKIDILLARIQQYGITYQYYLNVIDKADQMARIPFSILADFGQAVSNKDDLRQQREDLMTSLADIDRNLQGLKELVYAATTSSDQQDVIDRVNELLDNRDDVVSQVKDITDQLVDAEILINDLKTETEVRKYADKVIGEIRAKITALMLANYQAQQLLGQLETALRHQAVYNSSNVGVGNGRNFPQNKTVKVIIGGFLFSGTFSGDLFNIGSRLPRYTDVVITSIDNSRPDVFYIADPTISLRGMYCLMSTGYIIHVTEQFGTECQMELVAFSKPTGKDTTTKTEVTLATELSPATMQNFQNATAYTDGEKEKFKEEAIGKSDQGSTIKQLQDNIKGLTDLIPQATTESDSKDVQDAIYNDSAFLQGLLNDLQIPPDIENKLEQQLTDDEFKVALDLQNMNDLEQIRNNTPLAPQIPQDQTGNYYITNKNMGTIQAAAVGLLPEWLTHLNKDQFEHLPTTGATIIPIGTAVTLADNYQQKWVCNILPSTIFAVNAFRAVNGLRQLVPVPSSYYVKNESETMGAVQDGIFFGLHITSITFKIPLSQYPGQNWEDQPYVTLRSSRGPALPDVLNYLLTTYSSLGTSFGGGGMDAYPCNFALFTQPEVTQVCQEIAWQGRCRLFVRSGIAYLQYLSTLPSAVATITEDVVIENSLQITTTDTENLVTEFRAKYTPDYAYQDRNYQVVLRYNFTKYGRIAKNYDFFIYNIQSLVEKSALFWLIRLGITYKIVKFKTTLAMLNVESCDFISLNFRGPWVAGVAVLGDVLKAEYNSEDNTIDFEVWTPVQLGTDGVSHFAWPGSISETDVFPTVQDIAGGNSGNPIGQYVPTGQSTLQALPDGQLTPDTIDLVPPDTGASTPADANDTTPPSPIDGITEQDYDVDAGNDSNIMGPDYPMSTDEIAFNAYNGTDTKKNTNREPGTTVYSPTAGQGGTGALFGKVTYPIGDPNSTLDVTDQEQEIIDNLGTDEVINIYEVQLSNSQIVKATQLQIHSKSQIPFGTPVQLAYDPVSQGYQMQVPVWLDNRDYKASGGD